MRRNGVSCFAHLLISLLNRWAHITIRFWETQAQVAIDGVTLMTIYDCSKKEESLFFVLKTIRALG